MIVKEEGFNGLLILLPVDPNQSIETSSTCSSNASNDQNQISLQFPEDPVWNVFVMSAHSTVEIWLRIIGENYSVCIIT